MPRARATPGTLSFSRITTALVWLMVALDAAFLLGLIVSAGQNSPAVNVWLSLGTQWIPVSIFWIVAWHGGFRQSAVILAASAVTLSAVGDTYYSLAMDADGYLPFPSPADAGYLLFYPLMVAALVMLVRKQIRGVGSLVLLETVVATVGAAAVLAVVLDPMISDAMGSESALDSAIAVAYPLFDLLLLAVIAGIASVPTITVGRRWWALITGLSVFAVADIVYALLEHEGSYIAGTPLDATWAVGLGFITWWVAGSALPAKERLAARRFPLPIPAVAVFAGLAVLVLATQIQLSVLAVVLAALTVGLAAMPIIFRQAMLGRVVAAQEEAMHRLTDLDQDKSDMMVTLNHEFRTPLTSINGNVEVLLDGDAGELPDLAVRMLRTIENNGARLQDLVDDMLTVSRLEAGEAATRNPIYVSGLVTRAAALVAPIARNRGVDLRTECDNFALVVDADGTQLERALVNLVDNAVKFTASGGTVVVGAEGPTPEGHIVIRVSDTGMGIPAADIPRLFTRFFRASNVQDAAIPGVGLGLSITHRVVLAHEGTLDVDSTLGRGTTMTVRLPVSATGVLLPRRAPSPE